MRTLQISNEFRKLIEIVIPRILGLGDRDANSQTYGCFDRNYWHYKIIDFPNIRYQEAVLILGLLFKHKILDKFHGSQKTKNLISGTINFSKNNQNRDGSFNEVYPHERSFVCTSFVGWAITECLLLLGIQGFEKMIHKMGDWLLVNNNEDVSNQMAGAANTLYNIFILTKEEKYFKGTLEKIEILKTNKGNHLYLPEYGGADIGYLSIALNHLANLWKKSKLDDVYNLSIDAASYIENRLDEYGRFDWKMMSRKTQYVYPSGFAVLKNFSVLEKLACGLKNNMILTPIWMDDRFCIPFLLDYLLTYLELTNFNEK